MTPEPLRRLRGRVNAAEALLQQVRGTDHEHAARETLGDARRAVDRHYRGCPERTRGVDRVDFVTGTAIRTRADRQPPARRRGSTRARRTVRRRRPVGSRAGPDDDPGEPPKLPRRGAGG